MDDAASTGVGESEQEGAATRAGPEFETAEPWVLDGEVKGISTIGRVVVALLVMQIIGAMVQVWSSVLQLRLLESLGRAEYVSDALIASNDTRESVIAMATLGLLVVTGIAFLIWMRRAYGNLEALDYRREHGPGWAIGAWFVPFLNLVRPFTILREIYAASSPEREHGDPVIATTPAVMGVWWAVWLVGGFLEQGIMRMGSETLSEITLVTQATLVSTTVSMLGAGLAALLVHRITERQCALIARLSHAPTTF